jgi:hypothetical protein
MDLGAAAEGIAVAGVAMVFMVSLGCSIVGAILASIGWFGKKRLFFVGCLVLLAANQAYLLWTGAWGAAIGFFGFMNPFSVGYVVITTAVAALAVAGLRRRR